jgi:hypothetical protein
VSTVSVHQKVIQKMIAMLVATTDVTSYVPAAQIYLGHISTISDPKFPAITFHLLSAKGALDSPGFIMDINVQVDLWFKAAGKSGAVWDDVFTCYQAVLNTLHRNGGYDKTIGSNIVGITNYMEGPQMWEEERMLMHWPSRFSVIVTS